MSTCQFNVFSNRYEPFRLSRLHKNEEFVCFKEDHVELEIVKELVENHPNITCGLPTTRDSHFCQIHKCQVPGCCESKKAKFYLDDKPPSNYCENHTCHSCYTLCLTGKYCLEHKCHICDDEAIDDTGLCFTHITALHCAESECMNYVIQPYPKCDPKSSYHRLRYCVEHACENCGTTRKNEGSNLCSGCKCQYDSCNNVIDGKREVYCPEHAQSVCVYSISHNKRCKGLRYQGSRFCQDHKCAIKGCNAHIEVSDDYEDTPDYCVNHNKLKKICHTYFINFDELGHSRSEPVMLREREIKSSTPNSDPLTQYIKHNMLILSQKICEYSK